MDCVRLALVNLYKASPKQAHQSRVFLYFFTAYSFTENPFIKRREEKRREEKRREEKRREQNRTERNRTEPNKDLIIFGGIFRNCCTFSFSKLSKHLQATVKQPVHVEGDLIVRVRLHSECTAFLAYFR